MASFAALEIDARAEIRGLYTLTGPGDASMMPTFQNSGILGA